MKKVKLIPRETAGPPPKLRQRPPVPSLPPDVRDRPASAAARRPPEPDFEPRTRGISHITIGQPMTRCTSGLGMAGLIGLPDLGLDPSSLMVR